MGRRAKMYFRAVKRIGRIGIVPDFLGSLVYCLLRPRGVEMNIGSLMTTSGDTPDDSAVVEWHNSTRNIPAALLTENYENYERIRALTGMDSSWRVIDICCGTGHFAMPLLSSGFEVVGIDVSLELLSRSKGRLATDWRGTFTYGEPCETEFENDSFDAAVMSRRFLHVGNLLQIINETVRVVRPEGLVILIEDKGALDHTVRRLFRAQCQRRGHFPPLREVPDHDDLAGPFKHLDATFLPFDSPDLSWTKAVTYGECLEHLRSRFYSEFWLIPYSEYDDILRQVQKELEALPDGRERAAGCATVRDGLCAGGA